MKIVSTDFVRKLVVLDNNVTYSIATDLLNYLYDYNNQENPLAIGDLGTFLLNNIVQDNGYIEKVPFRNNYITVHKHVLAAIFNKYQNMNYKDLQITAVHDNCSVTLNNNVTYDIAHPVCLYLKSNHNKTPLEITEDDLKHYWTLNMNIINIYFNRESTHIHKQVVAAIFNKYKQNTITLSETNKSYIYSFATNKHLLTLSKCNNFQGIIVVEQQTEQGWSPIYLRDVQSTLLLNNMCVPFNFNTGTYKYILLTENEVTKLKISLIAHWQGSIDVTLTPA